MGFLTKSQESALDNFDAFLTDPDARYMRVSGSPGTGKSWLTQEMLKRLEARNRITSLLLGSNKGHVETHLTATTHKAANVLSSMSNTSANTIHSFLGLRPAMYGSSRKYIQKKNYPKWKESFILIDEAGMLCPELLRFLEKSTYRCKILFILDKHQLLPVGESQCAVANMHSPNIYSSELKEQVRSPGAITQLTEAFRDCLYGAELPEIVPDNENIFKVDGATFQKMVEDAYINSSDKDRSNLRILAWNNKEVLKYNQHIRSCLGLSDTPVKGDTLISNSCLFPYGIRNEEEVIIKEVFGTKTCWGLDTYKVRAKNKTLCVPVYPEEFVTLKRSAKRKKDWSTLRNLENFIGDFRPSYASTVHKAQGSSFDTVFIDLHDLNACKKEDYDTYIRLLIVATSRATNKVVFYGDIRKGTIPR